MKKLLSVLIVSTFMLSGMLDVNACGDKTLRVGKGIRFQQMSAYASRHPSAILIYSPAIPGGNAIKLRDYLKRIGHKPSLVDSAARLSEAISLGQYDLVLTDFAEAGNLQKQIASSSTRTVVVPVMLKHTKAEETAAARQYKVIVKNPTSADDFVAAVYQVMKSKANKS
jgi:hypothetical protein